ncbi:hypothetical protein [Rhizobium herbae]|jgi:hypothetical protein
MNSPEERRARWQKSVDHKAAHGLRVDNDPVFLAWIEEWIAGDVSIKEVQQRYAALLMSRDKSGLAANDVATASLMEEVRDELPEVAHLQIGQTVDRTKTTRTGDAAWGIDD